MAQPEHVKPIADGACQRNRNPARHPPSMRSGPPSQTGQLRKAKRNYCNTIILSYILVVQGDLTHEPLRG
jgi:hypothetical protein